MPAEERRPRKQPAGNAAGNSRRKAGGAGRKSAPRRQQTEREPRQAKNLPRRIAWEVLVDVETKDSYANLLLPAKLARTHMEPQDAAFTTELTYGALRQQEFYDAIIARAANRPSIDAEPLAGMRLGAHQILSMRVPDHAALSETVAVIKTNAPKTAGFVNAVLRRISEVDRAEWLRRVTDGATAVGEQAIEYSHPEWIVRAMTQALKGHGRQASELQALLEADNAAAKVSVSALPGLVDRSELPGAPTEFSPIGVTLETAVPKNVDAVATGRARVQDEGSALVALALAQVQAPAGTWADLCAGP
ncbi:MAG: transcription antitermination factor NusB, partial [Brevibacterium aurantiacum]